MTELNKVIILCGFAGSARIQWMDDRSKCLVRKSARMTAPSLVLLISTYGFSYNLEAHRARLFLLRRSDRARRDVTDDLGCTIGGGGGSTIARPTFRTTVFGCRCVNGDRKLERE